MVQRIPGGSGGTRFLIAAAWRQTREREADNAADRAYDPVIAPLKGPTASS